MVSIGMLPKEKDFRHLKRRKEVLEFQCAYVSEVVTWLAKRQGGNFTPPTKNYVEDESLKDVDGREIVDLTSPQVHHDQ
jgi:hypothetical protein